MLASLSEVFRNSSKRQGILMDEPCGGLRVGRTWVFRSNQSHQNVSNSSSAREGGNDTCGPRNVDSVKAWGSVQWLDLDRPNPVRDNGDVRGVCKRR